MKDKESKDGRERARRVAPTPYTVLGGISPRVKSRLEAGGLQRAGAGVREPGTVDRPSAWRQTLA